MPQFPKLFCQNSFQDCIAALLGAAAQHSTRPVSNGRPNRRNILKMKFLLLLFVFTSFVQSSVHIRQSKSDVDHYRNHAFHHAEETSRTATRKRTLKKRLRAGRQRHLTGNIPKLLQSILGAEGMKIEKKSFRAQRKYILVPRP